MNYGFHLATGGVLASMRRMDVIANNLANANTVGFKPDFIVTRERPAERIEGQNPLADRTAAPQEMLERLGGGIRFERDRIDLSQGTIERTGSPSDLAIRGQGFFVVADSRDRPAGRGAPIDLSRDGALVVDPRGTLRRAADGRALLGESGRPVTIDPTEPFAIDEAGRVFQEDTEVARLRIVRAKDPATLTKAGGNILRTPAVERVADGEATVLQSSLELSVADPIVAMTELMRQSRLLEANIKMLQYQDTLTSQAINGIARNA